MIIHYRKVRAQCDSSKTTFGSLNTHLGKLEENGYISSKRTLSGARPKTTYRITASGRKAMEDYLDSMKSLIEYVEMSKQN